MEKKPFLTIKTKFFIVSKLAPMLLLKKVPLSFNLFSVKSRLETVLTEFVDKNETFFDYKN